MPPINARQIDITVSKTNSIRSKKIKIKWIRR